MQWKNSCRSFSIRLARANTHSIHDWIEEQHKFQKPLLIEGKSVSKIKKNYLLSSLRKKKYPNTNYLGINKVKWHYDNTDKDRNLFRKVQIKTIMNHLKVDENQIKFP